MKEMSLEGYRRRSNAALGVLLLLLATVSGTLAFGYPLLDELAEITQWLPDAPSLGLSVATRQPVGGYIDVTGTPVLQ